MEKRYHALRLIAGTLFVFGSFALVLGLVLGIAFALAELTQKQPGMLSVSLAAFLYGVVGGVSLLAYSEIIHVILDFEEHLRALRHSLANMPSQSTP